MQGCDFTPLPFSYAQRPWSPGDDCQNPRCIESLRTAFFSLHAAHQNSPLKKCNGSLLSTVFSSRQGHATEESGSNLSFQRRRGHANGSSCAELPSFSRRRAPKSMFNLIHYLFFYFRHHFRKPFSLSDTSRLSLDCPWFVSALREATRRLASFLLGQIRSSPGAGWSKSSCSGSLGLRESAKSTSMCPSLL